MKPQLLALALALALTGGFVHADQAPVTRARITFNQTIKTGGSKNSESQYEFVVNALNGNKNCTFSIQTGKPEFEFKAGTVIDFDYGHSPGAIGGVYGSDRELIVSGGWAPSPGFYTTELVVSMLYYSGVDANNKVIETEDYQPVSVGGHCSIVNKSIISGIFTGPIRSRLEIPNEAGLIKMMSPYVTIEYFRE